MSITDGPYIPQHPLAGYMECGLFVETRPDAPDAGVVVRAIRRYTDAEWLVEATENGHTLRHVDTGLYLNAYVDAPDAGPGRVGHGGAPLKATSEPAEWRLVPVEEYMLRIELASAPGRFVASSGSPNADRPTRAILADEDGSGEVLAFMFLPRE
ncbi:hypothetical protein OG948_37235 (plasmid) [Embleya sp. NBC_00888]|uniref:hypothetical protein n=1 Tax=Embleya sp. NBC_00888 TaxID=2975960 RepID=UPI002F916C90|nr:hypothetical protein OG948_37235 [Embleya sp. NBC_00888]